MITEAASESVRRSCVFTTHTPVLAGHDQFPADLVRQVLGDAWADALAVAGSYLNGTLNMTYLALCFSRYVNGVAMRHGEVSRGMFPGYPINSIANGVHAVTWTTEPLASLYDRLIPEWRRDNLYLRYAVGIPLDEILQAHAAAKRSLLTEVERRTETRLDPAALTIGFARRATTYKRPALLVSNPDRLRRIARQAGPLQVLYGARRTPGTKAGRPRSAGCSRPPPPLRDAVTVVYLPEYDMTLAKVVCAGTDLWLNTPQKPQEASGTSGMKTALNGIPSLSVPDGWWVEGHLEGVTGWSIGEDPNSLSDPAGEAESLYDKLEYVVVPLFYRSPLAFAEVMRSAIALNGSFFNAQRMLGQYVQNAYFPPHPPGPE